MANVPTVKPSGSVIPRAAHLVLADISVSMIEPTSVGLTRLEALKKELAPLKGRVHVLAFGSEVIQCPADQLPEASGSTAMDLALERAIELEPRRVLLMSDGFPDSERDALNQAKLLALRCRIDTLFIGLHSDREGIAFLRHVARIGRGKYYECDLSQPGSTRLLETTIKQLLALPAPAQVVQLPRPQ